MWLWFRNAPKLRLHRSFTAAHPPMDAEVAPARNGCQHPFSVPAKRPTLEERPRKDPFQLAITDNQNWIVAPCPGAPKPGQARSQHDVVALFGAGLHPLATKRLQQLAAADLTVTNIKAATRLGASFKVYATFGLVSTSSQTLTSGQLQPLKCTRQRFTSWRSSQHS
jgi:hypothetical protein